MSYDDGLVQAAHSHEVARLGAIPAPPPLAGRPCADVGAREIATIADGVTAWLCWVPGPAMVDAGVRALLERERDWYWQHARWLPLGREVLYRIHDVALTPEAAP